MECFIQIPNWGTFKAVFVDGYVRRLLLSDEIPFSGFQSGCPIKRWLEDYFYRKIWRYPDFELDLSWATQFQKRVYKELMKIPFGRTITYGNLAEKLGGKHKARAVGNAVARNQIPLIIPCHRVVARNGIGGFTWGLDWKVKLLHHENAFL